MDGVLENWEREPNAGGAKVSQKTQKGEKFFSRRFLLRSSRNLRALCVRTSAFSGPERKPASLTLFAQEQARDRLRRLLARG
ncbi:hypothetical protein, partial [Variovorax sp. 22077]|uniref:hypothetical protein n=1 Tax=Variovorax sp. 22077 TaxID=3453867 RepID=UPI003F87BEC9